MPLAETRLDLSAARLESSAPGSLRVVSIRTPAVHALAGAFLLAAALGAFQIWRSRGSGWIWALWPWGLLTPAFAAIAFVFVFGEHEKSFHRDQNRAIASAGFGPVRSRAEYPLPATGKIIVSFRKERGSSAGGTAKISRWYDVDVDGQPGLGFTISGERQVARDFAARLAAALGYTLDDRAENDGVERR